MKPPTRGFAEELDDRPVGRRNWAAQWIWCRETGIDKTGEFSDVPKVNPGAHDRRVLFRRTLWLDCVPGRVLTHITADSRYVLCVNGRELARGPARSHPGQLLYDTVDIAPALTEGDNAICVLVRFYGMPNAWWLPATPTFSHGAGMLLAELELPGGPVGTGRDWRHLVCPAWTPRSPQGIGQAVAEVLDARLLDPRWLTTDFDDTGWKPARVLTAVHLGGTSRTTPPADPYGPLYPSPLGRPRNYDRPAIRLWSHRCTPSEVDHEPTRLLAPGPMTGDQLPLTLPLVPSAVTVVTADWTEIVAGTLVFELDAPAGTTVEARMTEELDDGTLPSRQTYGIRYVARGYEDTFRSADPSGGRYAVLALRGDGPVTLHRLSVLESGRNRPSGPYFDCDDPLLNEIYRVGLRTVDLTARDAYIDCPTREQRAWTGDSVVHQSVDLLANPDWRLARWHPQLAAAPRPDGMLPMAVVCDYEHRASYIPDFALHWIRSVHNLYRWTGDAEAVRALLPVVERVLRWFQPFVRDGLITEVTGWVLLDWSSVQGSGASSVLNGLWGRALQDFAEMSDWLGDAGRANWARHRHAELAAAFELFWDERRGGYRDWLREGKPEPAMSEHATAVAVVGGLVPPQRRGRALGLLLDRGSLVRRSWSFHLMPLRASMGPPAPDWDVHTEVVAAQPFFRYVVHDAVAELGAADRIAGLCRDWGQFLDAGERTWPETWEGGSHCHGWSATPSRDLPLYTLGVSPAEPGFGSARIAPFPGELGRVAGAVPTPHGTIEVRLGDRVDVVSPVPFTLELADRVESRPAGAWSWPR